MKSIVGTYECKIDGKSRLALPAALRKQLPAIADGFYLKRSIFQNCLELWPMSEWELMMEKMNGLNRFNPKNDLFIRKFMAGVKFVELDDAGRLLVSKDLLTYAQLQKNIVVSSKLNIIEIWDKGLYEQVLDDDSIDFGALTTEVMGND